MNCVGYSNRDSKVSALTTSSPISRYHKRLKALRLVSRQFAYNYRLLQHLFGTFWLVASPEYIKRLTEVGISRLLTNIKGTTFIAPLPTWTASFEDLEQAVHGGNVQGSQSLYLNDQFSQAGKLFRRHNARLKATWSSSRQDMLENTIVRLESLTDTGYECQYAPESPNEILQYDNHTIFFDHDAKQGEHSIVAGDLFLLTVIVCLAHTKVKPKTLVIQCDITPGSDWVKLEVWKKVDLIRLNKLEFRLHREGSNATERDLERYGRTEAVRILNGIFQRCIQSLESFSYGWFHTPFPHDNLLALPKLKKLELARCDVVPRELAAWISQLTSLEYLELDDTYCPGPLIDWFFLFAAIRDHTNRMLLDFTDVQTSTEGWTYLRNVYTGDHLGEKLHIPRCYGNDREHHLDHVDDCLALWMCGRIGITKCMTYWFDNNLTGLGIEMEITSPKS